MNFDLKRKKNYIMRTKPLVEEASEAVELHKIHEEVFVSEFGKSSDFDQLCNGIDSNLSSKRREIKELCIKLVHNLDKLSQAGDSERNNYCNYIPYWLY
ncbi:CYIR protein [Plasmodium cynomolgi strain B]|uniref:CYIR protein n=1 Tax=Plasmodium cynomolgi (strain B) TaxID=1120755 RepID=K6UF89_PLACD|nr:CYIR protein [Plasmodium cynomolgi strain B]GAB69681.1 CYIR protein [Plasmodium cynomolgi strain B]